MRGTILNRRRSRMRFWLTGLLTAWLAGGCTSFREGPFAEEGNRTDSATVDVFEAPDAALVPDDVVTAADRDIAPDAGAPFTCPAEMILIAAATFQMGNNATGSMPVHAVRLSAYCIDRTEVTVAAYRSCAGCMAAGTGAGCNGNDPGRSTHPINCVRWFEAEAYCRALGRRLPTEAEWEYAARGPEGRRYPWGSEAPGDQACWRQPSTCAAGTHPAGDSAFGLSDLAGNVAEWTADWHGAYANTGTIQDNPRGALSGTERVTRGGNWATTGSFPNALETTSRTSAPPDTSSPRVGFRCAR
jgi:formylglycine-generating enzyme required for sulfatase activity